MTVGLECVFGGVLGLFCMYVLCASMYIGIGLIGTTRGHTVNLDPEPPEGFVP